MRRLAPWLFLAAILVFFGGCAASVRAADQVAKYPSTLGTNWRASLQNAINATGGVGTVTAPSFQLGEERTWDQPLIIQPPPGQPFTFISLELPGNWRYTGTGPAIRTLGLKNAYGGGRIQFCGRLQNSNSKWLQIDGNSLFPSTNGIYIHDSIGVTTASNCEIVKIGSGTSNDVCEVTLERDSFNSDVYEGAGTTLDKLQRVHAAANRAVQCAGGNTVRVTVRDCAFSGFDVAIATAGDGPAGGSGIVVDGLDGSYNVLTLWLQTGFSSSLWNARQELGGHLVCWGDPLAAGRAGGTLDLRNVNCDSFDTSVPFWVDAGALVSINGNGTLNAFGVQGYGNNWSRCFMSRSNLAPGPTVSIAGCLNKVLGADGSQTVVPVTSVTAVEGLAVVK